MAFIDFHFYSEVLGMQSEAYVIIPQRETSGQIGIENRSGNEKYKCLYLLHGLSDDHTIWMRRTSIERYASEYGICVVMPCGHRSFYSNMACGLRYYDFIAKELPRLVCEFFNVSNKREDTFIGGLSMGGYGALKVALRESDRFAAGIGLSSVANIKGHTNTFALESVFGAGINIPDEDDLLYLAQRVANSDKKPRIYMAVGTEDFLFESNQILHNRLCELNYEHEYVTAPGIHNWEFWDYHIQGALKWLFGK